MKKTLKVDIHSHMTSPDIMGKAGKYGPERTIDSENRVTFRVGPYSSRSEPGKGLTPNRKSTDPVARLADMDEKGIDVMGVTVSPLCYLYWAEPEVGVPFATLVNDSLARFCNQNPDRLFFIPTLPLQDIKASLKEIDRAAGLGGRGINIGTDNIAGRGLDDPALFPIYERAAKHDLPIFLHPYPSPVEGGGEDKYNLSWVAGYVHQETVAFSHLTLGGVLDEFPNLKVCIPHGGGGIPYQFGRLEYAQERMPDVKAKKPLRSYLKNFYFDILVHDLPARKFLLDFMGAANLLVGSNYLGWDACDGFAMLDEMKLSDDAYKAVAGGNAETLFKLGR